MKKLQAQNEALLKALNSREEANFYDKEGQFTDTYSALEKYLPKRIFDNIRQILYGIKTPESPLQPATI